MGTNVHRITQAAGDVQAPHVGEVARADARLPHAD